MKVFLMAASLLIFTSCATSPSPQKCDDSWTSIDEGSSSRAFKVINPDSKTYLDRNCNALPENKGRAIKELVELKNEYHSYLNSSLESERELANAKRDDPEYAREIGKNEKYSEGQPNPYTVDEITGMIKDLKKKQSVLKDMRRLLKASGREMQYLTPMIYKAVRDWLALENLKKDVQEITRLEAHMKVKVKSKQNSDSFKKVTAEEMAAFMTSGYSQFNLSSKDFELLVVQGNGVDNYGLKLGQAVYKASKSKILKIVGNSKNKDVFTLEMKNNSNGEEVSFNFLLSKYAVLKSAEARTGTLTGSDAMAAWIMATSM